MSNSATEVRLCPQWRGTSSSSSSSSTNTPKKDSDGSSSSSTSHQPGRRTGSSHHDVPGYKRASSSARSSAYRPFINPSQDNVSLRTLSSDRSPSPPEPQVSFMTEPSRGSQDGDGSSNGPSYRKPPTRPRGSFKKPSKSVESVTVHSIQSLYSSPALYIPVAPKTVETPVPTATTPEMSSSSSLQDNRDFDEKACPAICKTDKPSEERKTLWNQTTTPAADVIARSVSTSSVELNRSNKPPKDSKEVAQEKIARSLVSHQSNLPRTLVSSPYQKRHEKGSTSASVSNVSIAPSASKHMSTGRVTGSIVGILADLTKKEESAKRSSSEGTLPRLSKPAANSPSQLSSKESSTVKDKRSQSSEELQETTLKATKVRTSSLESKAGGLLLKSSDRTNFFESLKRQEELKKASTKPSAESDLLSQVYIYHVDDDDDIFDDDEDDDDSITGTTSTDDSSLSTGSSSTSDGEPRSGLPRQSHFGSFPASPTMTSSSVAKPPSTSTTSSSTTSSSTSVFAPAPKTTLDPDDEQRFLKNIGWNDDDASSFDGWLTEEEIEQTKQQLESRSSSDQLKKPSSCPSLSFRSTSGSGCESESGASPSVPDVEEFVPDNWEDLRFHGGDDSFLESGSDFDD